MAFKDWNGNITIDEVAAEADIRKAAQAVAILKETESALKILLAETDGSQGRSIDAISTKGTEMLASVRKLISNLENMQSYTKQVIAKYRKLDREIKEMMEQRAREMQTARSALEGRLNGKN